MSSNPAWSHGEFEALSQNNKNITRIFNLKSSSPPLSAQRGHSLQSFLPVAQAGLAYAKAKQKQVVLSAVETAPSPSVVAGSSFSTLWWLSLCHHSSLLSNLEVHQAGPACWCTTSWRSISLQAPFPGLPRSQVF